MGLSAAGWPDRFLVMMASALFLSIWGTWTIVHTPVDALPDLSDVQVISQNQLSGAGAADRLKTWSPGR